MSEGEEMAWSMKKYVPGRPMHPYRASSLTDLLHICRFDEVLTHDGPLLLTSDDPRTQRVSRVCSRLIHALEEEDSTVIHGASWPPRDRVSELSKVIAERERGGGRASQRYEPSAKASSAMMPFRPESTNPLKVLEGGDWSLYVVDMVSSEPYNLACPVGAAYRLDDVWLAQNQRLCSPIKRYLCLRWPGRSGRRRYLAIGCLGT